MADPGIVVKVEGLDELQKALKKFPKEWSKIANQALKPGMAVLESGSKEEAPVDEGILRASIGSEIVKGPGSVIIGKVGSKLPYARAQEYGYPPRNLPAHPYLRPTLKKEKNRVIKMFEKGIAKALKRLGL